MVSAIKRFLIKRKLKKVGMMPYGKTEVPKKESILKRALKRYEKYQAEAPERRAREMARLKQQIAVEKEKARIMALRAEQARLAKARSQATPSPLGMLVSPFPSKAPIQRPRPIKRRKIVKPRYVMVKLPQKVKRVKRRKKRRTIKQIIKKPIWEVYD